MKKLNYLFVMLITALLISCNGKQQQGTETATTDDTVLTTQPEVMDQKQATVTVEAKSGSKISGTATFTEENGEVRMVLNVQNAEPGTHAVHIHENGDCSAADGTSAGGHWNPTDQQHGKRGEGSFHKGDIDNMEVGQDGNGTLEMDIEGWSIGGADSTNIVNKALVIHASADDFKSQPAGDAGARIGCGVIQQQ